ncbi:metal dependent phosphohydrolase [Neobacillus bataviensis LMG 21833]|uniref:Metal dependent phosphohydrolase n=1 Tax=Neobacillus bataviensis LMG 21833 TaxID=1117379 RepID=K6D8W2_9BACI|nr:HD domain-containing phosphohydrolase [Neobacillus bataviensis]EKN64764.1 metal dependent phosphohydrolase [Neobacillus bataviensis LMG 21833]
MLDLVLYHHERYDGKGYPKGLKGNEIPLAARIMAIADTFDAMTSNRVYRNAINLKHTLEEIKKIKAHNLIPKLLMFSLASSKMKWKRPPSLSRT